MERPSQVLVLPQASPGPDVLPSPADSSDVALHARAKSLRLHHKTENGVGGAPAEQWRGSYNIVHAVAYMFLFFCRRYAY